MVGFAVGACLVKAVCHDVPVSLPWLNGYICRLVFSWILLDFFYCCVKISINDCCKRQLVCRLCSIWNWKQGEFSFPINNSSILFQ